MTFRRLKRFGVAVLIIALAGVLLWRVKLHFVPAGAEPLPFLFASSEPQTISSPHGDEVHYRFHEDSAEDDGFAFTWCYVDRWLTGKKVVAAGYSLPAVQSGEESFPWHWHDDGGDFSVRFTVGREDETIRWFSGRLE